MKEFTLHENKQQMICNWDSNKICMVELVQQTQHESIKYSTCPANENTWAPWAYSNHILMFNGNMPNILKEHAKKYEGVYITSTIEATWIK